MPAFTVTGTLTLLRHGETNDNKKQIIQGHLDSELSETGLRQAQLVAQRLQYEKYTHIFSSDLERAAKTARTVLDCNQSDITSIIYDTRLRERKYGYLEGKSKQLRANLAKEAGYADVRHYTPPGAETPDQLKHRASLFFQELCQIVQDEFKKSEQCDTQPSETVKKRRVDHEHTDAVSKNIPTVENGRLDSGSIHGCSSSGSTSTLVDEEELQAHSTEQVVTTNGIDIHDIYDSIAHEQQRVSSTSSRYISSRGNRSTKVNGVYTSSAPIANILLSTHCGLIREFMRHFVDDLNCNIPAGRDFALKPTPNAGLSKFVFSFDNDQQVQVNCVQLHDKDHLNESENNN